MRYTYTRTHTRYFGEDHPSIKKLDEAIKELSDDDEVRRPYLDPEVNDAFVNRLEILGCSRRLLTEIVQ